MLIKLLYTKQFLKQKLFTLENDAVLLVVTIFDCIDSSYNYSRIGKVFGTKKYHNYKSKVKKNYLCELMTAVENWKTLKNYILLWELYGLYIHRSMIFLFSFAEKKRCCYTTKPSHRFLLVFALRCFSKPVWPGAAAQQARGQAAARIT